jgi:hypothetical protein
MASPPKGGIPAYGSLRSTGGMFRGKALGHAINIGDANEVWEGMDVFTERSISISQTLIHPMSTSPSHPSLPMFMISISVKPFKMLLVAVP